jgi:hypothetical protein
VFTGIAWYEAEQWEKLREIAADPEQLEDAHADWLRHAEQVERDLRRRGIIIRRIPIDLGALVAWCRRNNRPIDAAARAEFTSERIQRFDQPGAGGGPAV